MSRTRVLIIPAYFGLPSHFIPLVKLYQKLPDDCDPCFFVPRLSPEDIAAQGPGGFNMKAAYYYSTDFLGQFDIPLLDMGQRHSVINELAAYRRFRPDLVIDDSSLTTALARQILPRPRLTIARNGVFGDPVTPSRHRHSLDSMVARLKVPPPMRAPETLDGFFEAEAYVIPAAPSLEPLPGLPRGRAFYSGPLMLDEAEEGFLKTDALEKFLELNRRARRIAYVTFGIDVSRDPHSTVWSCMRELLRRDFAIVSNMRAPADAELGGGAGQDDRYLCSEALPFHHLCAASDLIVHVCGSATYHYPILHGRPAITIGTCTRDREDVAQKLADRGFSIHLPAPAECADFLARFVEALDRFEAGLYPFDAALSGRLAAQRMEIERTSAGFDAVGAIEAALAAAPASRAAAWP